MQILSTITLDAPRRKRVFNTLEGRWESRPVYTKVCDCGAPATYGLLVDAGPVQRLLYACTRHLHRRSP